MKSGFPGTGATPELRRETSATILPPALATPTRTFPKPRCFSATSIERTAHEHIDSKIIDSKTESDDQDRSRSGGVRRDPLHRLARVHAGVSVHYSEVRLRELRAEDPQMHVLR